MTTENDLTELKQNISKANEQKMRAELAIESANEMIESSYETLGVKFKVKTEEEALALLEKLETSIAQKLQEAQELLKAAQ